MRIATLLLILVYGTTVQPPVVPVTPGIYLLNSLLAKERNEAFYIALFTYNYFLCQIILLILPLISVIVG